MSTNIKMSISDYTELEFLELVNDIFLQNSAPTNEKLDQLLDQFVRVVEHPESADLIYYSSDENCNPEAVTRIIKKWHAQNGKPGFKIT